MNKEWIVERIGENKYDSYLSNLEEMKKQEENKGLFLAIADDVDRRPESLKDYELSPGFKTIQCGLRGSKLSGGQK